MIPKRLLWVLLGLFAITILVACGGGGRSDMVGRTIYVGPYLVDCMGSGQRQCLPVKEGVGDRWFYFSGQIEGFQYEEGYVYELEVAEYRRAGLHSSSLPVRVELVRMLNKTQAGGTVGQAALASLEETGKPLEVWTAAGLNPLLTVSAQLMGWCSGGSPGVPRSDAWRCYAGEGDTKEVLDPCFANPFGSGESLACLRPDKSIAMLVLSSTLPIWFANPEGNDRLPVGLTLTNGDECSLLNDGTATIEGKRVTYRCESGALLLGDPDTSAEVWTIEYRSDEQGTIKGIVPIAHAAAFRGDTAWIGSGPSGQPTGVLTGVSGEIHQGFTRITFAFTPGGMPSYDLAYTTEPAREAGSDQEITVAGQHKLRVWFYPAYRVPPKKASQKTALPTYAGPLRVPLAGSANVNEVVFAGDTEGEMDWYVGMNQLSGFRVTPLDDPPRLVVDVYDPVPRASERAVLNVGTTGPAVRILQDRMVQLGYLPSAPAQPEYDQETAQAVATFEEQHGLSPDGVTGPEVWAALDRPVPRASVAVAAATPSPAALGLPRTRSKEVAPAVPPLTMPPDVMNIVLLGTDVYKPGRIWRTDVIIVLSVNMKEKRASLLSIPRDTWVYIPTIGYNRINTADVFGEYAKYPGGGAELVKRTILHNLGIPVQYYIRGNFGAFTKLIDALGGVDVVVDCPLTDRIIFNPGIQHMDGSTALVYARSRKTTSDFDRNRRQHKVIRAVLTKAWQTNLVPKIPELWNALGSLVQTDLSTNQILSLAYTGLQLQPHDIKSRFIGYGQVRDFIAYGGAMVLMPRPAKMQEAVAEFFEPPEPALQVRFRERARVMVQNGTKRQGRAELAADRLRWEGIPGAVVAEADEGDYPKSRLIVYAEKPNAQERLETLFNISPDNVQVSPRPAEGPEVDLVVILGRDYDPCRR